MTSGLARVACIIPAKDESRRIAATVRSARAIPHVDLVLVVDDGSVDNTQHVAREAGAVVLRDTPKEEGGTIRAFAVSYTAERQDAPADVFLGWDPGLPLEEVGFFVVIPVVTVLTYEAVKVVRGNTPRSARRREEV